MGQALYRKYRSKSLSEIVGQEHITDTLAKALASGRISHAYLFSGPRGVGKTSIARILAHEINGLAYTDDSAHLDIIEIDAASNRRIDEIRELREKVYIAPTSGKYKVYIIDEVHMLTREAFNALLKTLEEPPAHAVFILATTEAHKLPETIVSRTQHYTFKPVEPPKVIEHLRHIATTEGVRIDDDALALLAAHGGGSFRDSISVLDQAQSISAIGSDAVEIDAAAVRQLLGIAPDEAISGLIGSLQQATGQGELLGKINALYGQGLQAAAIAHQLADKLRTSLATGQPLLPVGQALGLMKHLIEVTASRNPERLLEIILLESAEAAYPTNATVVTVAVPAPVAQTQKQETPPKAEAVPPAPEPPMPSPNKSAPAAQVKTPSSQPSETTPPAHASKTAKAAADAPAITTSAVLQTPDMLLDAQIWPEVLGSIKKEYNTLYGVLRMANPIFGEDSIELQLKFAFHQKRLNEAKNRDIIADFIKRITGRDVTIICTYKAVGAATDTADAASGSQSSTPPETMEAITNIFGGAEIL
jgi:DNA polymerase-3 subunit gamma/tau